MSHLLPVLAVALLLVSCAPGYDLAGYDKHTGDLGSFILERALKFGAHPAQTNGLPQLTADWRSKEDANVLQVYVAGDHYAQLESFLVAAFGPPDGKEMADAQAIGSCYSKLGVEVSFSRQTLGVKHSTC